MPITIKKSVNEIKFFRDTDVVSWKRPGEVDNAHVSVEVRVAGPKIAANGVGFIEINSTESARIAGTTKITAKETFVTLDADQATALRDLLNEQFPLPPVADQLRATLRRLQDKEPMVNDARFSDAIGPDRRKELEDELTELNTDISAFCRTIAFITETTR